MYGKTICGGVTSPVAENIISGVIFDLRFLLYTLHAFQTPAGAKTVFVVEHNEK